MIDLELVRRDHAEAARARLPVFVKQAWRILEPETPLLWNWHHSLICEYLTAVKTGQIRRLVINVAPRMTKSLLASVCFPDWWWTDEPHRRFLFGSYSGPFATKHSVLRRNLVESNWYQRNYGDRVQLTADTNMKTEFANSATGTMKAAGIKAGATGEGADCVILDDPHNPKGAESEADREATLQALDLMWTNRLNDKKTGRIVCIMQRLHMNDATAHLLSKGLGYELLKIPTVAEGRTTIVFPLSKRRVVREDGALIHPERDGPEQIEVAKKEMGSFGFAGQHQQNPVPREGAIVKVAWLSRFYRDLPERFEATLQSWDLTFKGTTRSDYVVGLALGRLGGDFYLFPHRVRAQLNFPETLSQFRAFSAAHPQVVRKVVEAKANGAALIDTLKKEVPGIVPYEPHGTKEERLAAVSPIMEAGNLVLPDPSIAPWVHEFIEEVTAFPRAPNDDYVDALTQGLSSLAQRKLVSWNPVSITAPSKWL